MNAPLRHPVTADAPSEGPWLVDAERYERMAAIGIFDDAGRLELRGGTIVTMTPQADPHMWAKTEIGYALRAAIAVLRLKLRVGIEGSLRLDDREVPEPDIIVIDGPPGAGFVPGSAARLVVEVADTSLARDLGAKADLYARHAIPEYWVADLQARVVYRHSAPGPAGYATRDALPFAGTIGSATIPNLAVDLTEL